MWWNWPLRVLLQMKVIDKKLLAEFRTPGPCEFCGIYCKVREPAHIYSVGAGRLDIRENLVALGSTRLFLCTCHSDSHAGCRPTRIDLLEIAARREGTTPEEITEKVYRLRRETKCKSWVVS